MTIEATAPGKIILFGEHAVVYGQPALAVPLSAVKAKASIQRGSPGSGLRISAVNLNANYTLQTQSAEALVVMANLVLAYLNSPEPDAILTIDSTIPLASGLGSGAAVSAALGRALAAFLNKPLDDAALSELVYQVEKLHHGTPSGIDNTVVCYNQPVYFIKDKVLEPFEPRVPLQLVIGDTGIASPTRKTVKAVREAWERDRSTYDAYFQAIGEVVNQSRSAIEDGDLLALGALMVKNQELLEQIGVSCSKLETLIDAAQRSGALGAKLSGGGGGGNMIALTMPDTVDAVAAALLDAGAVNILKTVVT